MWSDETEMELFRINTTHHVWRWKNAESNPKNTKPGVKHRGGGLVLGVGVGGGGWFCKRDRATDLCYGQDEWDSVWCDYGQCVSALSIVDET